MSGSLRWWLRQVIIWFSSTNPENFRIFIFSRPSSFQSSSWYLVILFSPCYTTLHSHSFALISRILSQAWSSSHTQGFSIRVSLIIFHKFKWECWASLGTVEWRDWESLETFFSFSLGQNATEIINWMNQLGAKEVCTMFGRSSLMIRKSFLRAVFFPFPVPHPIRLSVRWVMSSLVCWRVHKSDTKVKLFAGRNGSLETWKFFPPTLHQVSERRQSVWSLLASRALAHFSTIIIALSLYLLFHFPQESLIEFSAYTFARASTLKNVGKFHSLFSPPVWKLFFMMNSQ